MKRILRTVLGALLTLAAPTLWAQGSGSSAPSPSAGGGLETNFVVTRTVDATILEITPNVIVVREVTRKGTEKFHELRYTTELAVGADKRTELGQSKKRFDRNDLKAGQFVRITWRADDLVAIDVRVIPAKNPKV